MTTSIDPTTPLTYNPVIDALVGSWRQIIDADYSADDTRLPDLAVLARSTARAVAAAVPRPLAEIAAPDAPDERGELMLLDKVIQEVADREYTPLSPDGPSVGDLVLVTEKIYNSDREEIGADTGRLRIIRKDPETGHHFTVSLVTSTVQGNKLFAFGYTEMEAQLSGGRTTIQAACWDGPWAGMSGTLSWVINSMTAAESRYELRR
ncbi:hypothetical protein [Streptomyces sp. NP-1717]|uniref:allene oxide cyclase barrel-like domain-containing protein n=1 Tax=unclassified Streptomyces TaxID=2593676 RepID=UPI001F5DCAFB|nr:hypothetical protein [Streptomyces sp. NP-1717]MCI3225740.1 hypothetical protein [Streptomyces sp. NP-1717]